MERGAWTDDLGTEIRGEFWALRSETREGCASLRSEMPAGVCGMRAESDSPRLVMLRVGGGIILALIGVIAAILARGA
jgi:hypothetical protein